MKITILILLVTLSASVFAQKNQDLSADWAKRAPDYKNGADILTTIARKDLSKFWLSGSNSQNGVFGMDYWRIELYISEVQQSGTDPLTYKVKGKDRHKDVVTPFEGTITITKATRYSSPHMLDGTSYPIEVVASYRFEEDTASKYSGTFTGTLRTDLLYKKDKPDEFLLDDLGDDGFMNNTYVGIWKSRSGKVKKCIWGLERLPYTDDWDEGAGEIHVSDKYVMNGWEDYMKQVNAGKPPKNEEWWK